MDRVLIYSLEDPSRPRYAGRVRTRSPIGKLLPGDSLSSQLAYGLGKRLHVLDFSDLGRPAELNSWPLRARAVGGARRGELVYVFFANGLEVFSAPDGHAPESIGFHSSAGEVRNGFVFGKSAIAVKAAGHIDIIDVSSRSVPRLASQLRMEKWMSEVIPLAGALPRSRNRLLALTPDQRGFRVLRIRTNKVDQEKLRSWRASRMSQRTA
jgi:hypothetical protein